MKELCEEMILPEFGEYSYIHEDGSKPEGLTIIIHISKMFNSIVFLIGHMNTYLSIRYS